MSRSVILSVRSLTRAFRLGRCPAAFVRTFSLSLPASPLQFGTSSGGSVGVCRTTKGGLATRLYPSSSTTHSSSLHTSSKKSSQSKMASFDRFTNFFKAPPHPGPLGYRRILSKTSGVRVSPLCLGTMSIGDQTAAYTGGCTKEEAFAFLDAFYDAGGNFIDTAAFYHFGQSEEWLGEWMELRGNRDKLIIATKYASPTDGDGKDANHRGNSAKTMSLTIRDSLKRLRTDYVDILYLHFWDHTTSVEEIMRGLHKFVMNGQILYPGISDSPAWVVIKANDFARANSLSPFVIYQGKYSIATRDLERELIPMCRDQGMALAVWGVIGQGKFKTKAEIEARQQSGDALRASPQKESEVLISAALEKVANDVGASLASVAISYAIQKNAYLFPIIGGNKPKYLQDNIQALTLQLTDEQIKELEAVVPFDFGFPFTMFGTDPHASGGRETSIGLKNTQEILYVQDGKAPIIPKDA